MENLLIGREEEKKILEAALHSPKAEMVSVIGRRRVGKPYLIKTIYQDHFRLLFSKKAQLLNLAHK